MLGAGKDGSVDGVGAVVVVVDWPFPGTDELLLGGEGGGRFSAESESLRTRFLWGFGGMVTSLSCGAFAVTFSDFL